MEKGGQCLTTQKTQDTANHVNNPLNVRSKKEIVMSASQ